MYFWMFNFELQCKKMQPIIISSYITWSLLFLSEYLFWFIFFVDISDAKLVSSYKNGKTWFYMLIIRSFWAFRQLRGFVAQSESAKSAEIFRSWNFSFFDLEISEALLKYIKQLILNVSGAVKQEITNFYQLLWHVVPAFNLIYPLLSILQNS